MSVNNMWRIEKTDEAVGFWIGHQGFTVYCRGEGTPCEDHKELLWFYERNLRVALNKLKPEHPLPEPPKSQYHSSDVWYLMGKYWKFNEEANIFYEVPHP